MAFCQNCGNDIAQARFCTSCGNAAAFAGAGTKVSVATTSLPAESLETVTARAHRRARCLATLLLLHVLFTWFDFIPLLPDSVNGWFFAIRAILFLLTVIFWLSWTRAASAAATLSSQQEPRYRSLILIWFLPILNLFRPFQVTADLWRRSQPSVSRSQRPPILLVCWWLTCLALVFVGFFGGNSAQDLASDHYRVKWLAGILTSLLPFAAAAFALFVVIRIDALQSITSLAACSPVLPLKLGAIVTPRILAATFCVLFAFSASGVFSLLIPSPEASLLALADAFNKKDLAKFNEYFDADTFLYTSLRQAMEPEAAPPSNIPWILATKFQTLALNTAYPFFGPDLAKNMASLMVTGHPASEFLQSFEICRGVPGIICAPASLVIQMMDRAKAWGDELRGQFHGGYRGVSQIKMLGDFAVVTVQLAPTLRGTTVDTSATVTMQRFDNHWRVVDAAVQVHNPQPASTRSPPRSVAPAR